MKDYAPASIIFRFDGFEIFNHQLLMFLLKYLCCRYQNNFFLVRNCIILCGKPPKEQPSIIVNNAQGTLLNVVGIARPTLELFARLYFPIFSLNTEKYRPEKTLTLDTVHAMRFVYIENPEYLTQQKLIKFSRTSSRESLWKPWYSII